MNADPAEPIRPGHPRWQEFVQRLAGPEGCNFQDAHWTCYGDLRLAEALLDRMGVSRAGIASSLAYFKVNGGYCDCEILMNVARPGDLALPRLL